MALPDIQAKRQEFFKSKRDDIERQTRGQQQEVGDALSRRFTSLGQAGSGAAMDAQLKAREQVNAQGNAARNELAGHELQAGEADFNRQFQSDEAKTARDFAAAQAEKDMGFKRSLFDIEQGNKLKELDLAERQFLMDKDTTEFNKRMAEIEGNRKAPGLLGGDGFLGTGLDLKDPLGSFKNNPGEILLKTNPVTAPIAALTGGGGGCFLTTAAVDVMGMQDDCWVLDTARMFRDTYMTETPERAREIQEYYEIAPQVVENINAREDAEQIWKRFFWKDIVPFVDAASLGENEVAHERYKNLISKAKDLGGMNGN